MKYLIKTVLLFLIVFSLQTIVQAQDTIRVKISDGSKIVVIAKNREELNKLRNVDVNSILEKVINKIMESDTTKKERNRKFRIYDISTENETISIIFDDDVDTTAQKQVRQQRFRTYWDVDLGLNSYLENGSSPSNNKYTLDIPRSRFVSIGTFGRMRLGKVKSPFSLHFGLELSVYNFMFANQNYISVNNDKVDFRDYKEDFDREVKKSKLVIPYINLPLMLKFKTRDHKNRLAFHMGVGGYAGYRLGAYSKTKLVNDKKDKTKNSYYLNTWRYGLEGHIGFRGLTLFAKYDLNELFIADKGPKLNAFSFGIRL